MTLWTRVKLSRCNPRPSTRLPGRRTRAVEPAGDKLKCTPVHRPYLHYIELLFMKLYFSLKMGRKQQGTLKCGVDVTT